jgi:hypothetical protein
MLAPVLIFIGAIGWLICSLEPSKRIVEKALPKMHNVKSEDDGVTFIPVVHEECNEIISH